ncbi:MAG: EI24 domain-containing protein [Saprospiraceae bacterium]|nr:EI24 domain-containing protein [Saprospiraceae bacterium]
MIRGFIDGIQGYLKAIPYLFYPWVLRLLLVSGLVSLICFSLLACCLYFFGGNSGEFILNFFFEDGPPEWLSSIVSIASQLVLWILLFLVLKYIILIVTAPFMSLLSERLEEKLRDGYKDPQPGQLYSLVRGLRLSLSNLVREIFLLTILFVFSFIPGLAIFTIVLTFMVQSYYAGFGNIDFFMERRFSIRQSRNFIRRHKGFAMANGFVFLFLFLIPILGAILAPALATISGTITSVKLIEEGKF